MPIKIIGKIKNSRIRQIQIQINPLNLYTINISLLFSFKSLRLSKIFLLYVTDSLSTMLRLLGEESAEASQLIQAWSRIDLVELCDKEQQPRLYNVIYIIYVIYIIHNRADRAHVPYRAKGFLRRKVVYLKDYSPYLDSSLFVVNLKIQLELIYQATTLLVIIILLPCLYLYTRPNNRTYHSFYYKVPLYIYY